MMMSKYSFRTLRQVLLTVVLAGCFIAFNSQAQTVRQVAGQTPASLNGVRLLFYNDLGGNSNGVGGSYTSGFRELDFEDFHNVPGNVSPFQMPFDFYSRVEPRGVQFNTSVKPSGTEQTMLITAPACVGCDLVQFRDSHVTYDHAFTPFSGTKMLGLVYDRNLEIGFRIPGTDIPATVKGFGMVFADVDFNNTYMTAYDETGKVIYGGAVPVLDDGFSFLGVSFANGTRIARVTILLGWSPLIVGNAGFSEIVHNGNWIVDYVAADNLIIGEPRAMEHHSTDFDGDGGSDLAMFRPSDGTWYLLNSGSNTFTSVQFGVNGDIPVDGDFDGDARNDLAVFRPSNGTWYILRSSTNQFQSSPFGANGDKPVAADFDRDGVTDIAVWRPSDGNYYSLNSSDGQLRINHWGAPGDIPVGTR
jgi:hypothetical protein